MFKVDLRCRASLNGCFNEEKHTLFFLGINRRQMLITPEGAALSICFRLANEKFLPCHICVPLPCAVYAHLSTFYLPNFPLKLQFMLVS